MKNGITNGSESMNIFSGGLIPQMKVSLALSQRKIYLYDDVEGNSIFECIYYLNKLMDIDKTTGEKPPIDIYISSDGGIIYEGFALLGLIESMKDSGYVINTINMSKAFSMGFIIAICGTNRYANRYASYMFHDVSCMTWGKLEYQQERMEESLRLRKILHDITTKYTKLEEKDLSYWLERKQDKFFSTEEAIQFGIVDKIL